MSIILENLNYNDEETLNIIFELRNDKSAYEHFINNNPITQDTFKLILDKYKQSNIIPQIILYNNIKVGIICFTLEDDKLYIGININKDYRGKKIGDSSIQLIIEKFKNNLAIKRIYASIKKTNIASNKLFIKYFIFEKSDEIYNHYIYYNNIDYVLCSANTNYTSYIFNTLNEKYKDKFLLITDNSFFKENIIKIKPIKCFFAHWSYIVPKDIYINIECINFHTANLPYGRGGTPLQNQIIDGINNTFVNSLQITSDGIDSGPLYIKTPITLQGNIFDIFLSISKCITLQITNIIEENIKPQKIYNYENIPIYKRITNNELIVKDKTINEIYDQIRMRDSEYYEKTYIVYDNIKISFKRAYFDGKKILCDAEIITEY